MGEDLYQYLRETPWPEVRDRIRSTATAGGIRSLETAASIGTLADHVGVVPASDRVLDEVWESLNHAQHPVSWLTPRLLAAERCAYSAFGFRSDNLRWEVPPQDPRLPAGTDRFEGPFPIDNEAVCLTQARDRGPSYTYAGACFLTEPGAPIGQQTLQLMVSAMIPSTPILGGCIGSFASRLHPDAVIRCFADHAMQWPFREPIGYAGSRLAVWRALAMLTGQRSAPSSIEVFDAVREGVWCAIEPRMDRVGWPDRVSNCYAYVNESRGETSIMMWDNGKED